MKACGSFHEDNTKFAPVLYWMMYNVEPKARHCISDTIKVAHIIFSAYEFLHFRISPTKETKKSTSISDSRIYIHTQQQLHSITQHNTELSRRQRRILRRT